MPQGHCRSSRRSAVMPFRFRTTELSSLSTLMPSSTFQIRGAQWMNCFELGICDLGQRGANYESEPVETRAVQISLAATGRGDDFLQLRKGPGASGFGAGIPDCFCSHGLTLDDLSSAGVTVLRKR